MKTTEPHPHEMLEGLVLTGGWRVDQRVDPGEDHSGSYFSCGYRVTGEDGTQGYLKAFDFFSRLPESDDPARTLEPLLKAFNFERELLERCRQKHLSRVITALGYGAVNVPGFTGISTVQYIIFELAETDFRGLMSAVSDLDIAMAFRTLHHIAVGLNQLHGIGIAHQDLKPSNVLLFDGMKSSKLADLGRAAEKGNEPPHYGIVPAGHRAYAPPELLYDASDGSWERRRMGCDTYHLGSMISSIFTTVGMTPLVVGSLDRGQEPFEWKGDYESALLFLRPAFARAVDYVVSEVPHDLRGELEGVIGQLCEPDPKLRGHPRDRSNPATQFALHRYVSLFDRLAKRAELLTDIKLRRDGIAG